MITPRCGRSLPGRPSCSVCAAAASGNDPSPNRARNSIRSSGSTNCFEASHGSNVSATARTAARRCFAPNGPCIPEQIAARAVISAAVEQACDGCHPDLLDDSGALTALLTESGRELGATRKTR